MEVPTQPPKDALISQGFSERFLNEMAKTIQDAIKTNDSGLLGPLLEKIENSKMHKYPEMTKLLDEYVGELIGVDVKALRQV
jgi:hypothetical protein